MEYNIYFLKACCAIAAAFCMGIGSIAPALGEGNAVAKALEGMARQQIIFYLQIMWKQKWKQRNWPVSLKASLIL